MNVHADERRNMMADADLLVLALNNLLSNAVRHSPAGSMVTLSARSQAEGEVPGILFTVVDTGPLIPPEQQALLFVRYQCFGDYAGSGIGLWATREIAQAHHGNAGYIADPERGNCFFIWIPIL